MKTIKKSGVAHAEENDIELEINKISAPKFKDGGAAILHAAKQNHQKHNEGNKFIIPLVINILRDETVSYVMFARENIQEEHSPCAKSIIIAPCQPQGVLVMIPAVAIPMCLTEE